MTALQWLFFIAIVQLIHGFGTWKLYIKAGRHSWEAFVPVYNAIVLMQIINRPKWYAFLLFIPVINLIMFPVVWVETIRSFGYNTAKDTALAILSLGFYTYYINYTKKTTYITDRSLVPTNKTADTISSLLFAIIVATFVHTYFIQPFIIPTSSLEKSLLVGDFLFVSKYNYGARTPITTVAAPMVHDTIPLINTKSYSSWPQLPYFRFPGYEKIKNNDIVVFNWPIDTVYKFRDNSGLRAYKPIDKKSNYVKRCVGIAGDSLQIKDGIVFINGKELILPERARQQYSYSVTFDRNSPPNFQGIVEELDITDGAGFNQAQDTLFIRALTFAGAERMKNMPGITSVTRIISKNIEKAIFPHTKNWNVDNVGPIYIPQAGKSVALNAEKLPFYKAIITDYEGNTLQQTGNEIRINGQVATSYTFKQDYYWMMGDNRHNSEDSRYWGYVPADHIVGKPIFIWISWDSNAKGIMNKIRWKRLFTTVSGEGQPQSYFKFFLIFLAGYFAFDYFRAKKKKKEENQ